MPINLTRAWTASSLTPTIQPGAPVAPPTATGTNPNSSVFNTIMSQIFGPNYQSVLNTGDRSGQIAPAADPALIEAQAYAAQSAERRNLMEQSIMQTGAANWNARWNSSNPVANPVGGAFGSAVNPDFQTATRYQQTLDAAANRSAMVAQAAALSPQYAPGVQNSVGQQNTGASFNPFSRQSGWVSPVNNNFQSGVSRTPAFNIMSAGV